MSNVFIKL